MHHAVAQRARWIYTQLHHFREQQAYITPRRYISGESHYYLGRRHVLKVMESDTEAQSVKMLRGKLVVTVRDKHAGKVRQRLHDWYKARAKVVFRARLEVMLERALWVDECPPIRLQTMQTQWGSCSPRGRLTLNPLLVKAPRECIDYVILHELCHLAEHNHSPRFYRLMTQVMPEWRTVKTRLDGMAASIFAA